MKKYCSLIENEWSCANINYKQDLCAKHYRRKNNLKKERFCYIETCNRVIDSKNLCSGHYRRYIKHGDTFDKTTPLRKQNPNRKILDDEKYPKFGECLVPRCIEEINIKGTCFRHYRWLKKHELIIFDIINDLENGCKSCGSIDDLTIDHNHSICSGKSVCKKCYRGILCRQCNLAAGYLNDDPQKIKKLAKYLEDYNLEKIL